MLADRSRLFGNLTDKTQKELQYVVTVGVQRL